MENFLSSRPDRGRCEEPRAVELIREIYQPILEGSFVCTVHADCQGRAGVPFVVTDTNSAELIKHASNAFLAMKIFFVNIVADLCEAGADVNKVA